MADGVTDLSQENAALDKSQTIVSHADDVVREANKILDRTEAIAKADTIFTEKVVIALTPVVAYGLCFAHKAAYLLYFRIPLGLIYIDLTSILITSVAVLGLFKKRLIVTALGSLLNISDQAAVIGVPALFVGLNAFFIFDAFWPLEGWKIWWTIFYAIGCAVGWAGISLGVILIAPKSCKLPNSLLGCIDFVYWKRCIYRWRANYLRNTANTPADPNAVGKKADKLAKKRKDAEAKVVHMEDVASNAEEKLDSGDEIIVFVECIVCFVLLMFVCGWNDAKTQKDFLMVVNPDTSMAETVAESHFDDNSVATATAAIKGDDTSTTPEKIQLAVIDFQDKRVICLDYDASANKLLPQLTILALPEKTGEKANLYWQRLKTIPTLDRPSLGPPFDWL
jgi:hypothetical protein